MAATINTQRKGISKTSGSMRIIAMKTAKAAILNNGFLDSGVIPLSFLKTCYFNSNISSTVSKTSLL